MIILITYLDKDKILRVSHGIDFEFGEVITLPEESINYYQRVLAAYWDKTLCEWIME